ncbi:hypothetical protein BH20VER1_BH20VER1_17070 [soil metagenome]
MVFLNHAAWWDPLICLLLAARFFPGRAAFAPIEAKALQRYRFLGKLGFFGVTVGSARGAAEFLRVGTEVLQLPQNMLWLTPQGKFTDVRARPVTLQSGLAHLARRSGPAVFLPLAIGTPLFNQQHRDLCGADDWAVTFASALQDAQEALANASLRRNPDEWQVLLRGRAGAAPLYDLWRRLRALVTRQPFQQEHSTL